MTRFAVSHSHAHNVLTMFGFLSLGFPCRYFVCQPCSVAQECIKTPTRRISMCERTFIQGMGSSSSSLVGSDDEKMSGWSKMQPPNRWNTPTMNRGSWSSSVGSDDEEQPVRQGNTPPQASKRWNHAYEKGSLSARGSKFVVVRVYWF